MSNRPRRIPKYRQYKPKGLGVVRIDGRDVYLGKYNSPESWEKYHRLIGEWLTNGRKSRLVSDDPHRLVNLSINEMLLAYWQFAKTYYSKDGRPTKELACMREALRPLRQLYGSTNAREFGPKALKAVRQDMIDGSLCRGLINHRIGRIKRVFKWAVAEELIPPHVYHGLQAVSGLRYGRTQARETAPIKPVDDTWVDAVLPYVSPPVAAMIQLQRLTDMRPCEVVVMRPCDIDQAGDIWIYEPYDHKNRWRGHERKIPLGPRTQEIVRPFLNREPNAFLFSPQEAEQWRHAQRRRLRKTPMTPSQAKRKPRSSPKRPKRDRYDTAAYRGAIVYGIRKANRHRNGNGEVPHWHPLQIRHSRGTAVRHRYGLDAAQPALGHARADVTQVYAEKNMQLAIRIAREMG